MCKDDPSMRMEEIVNNQIGWTYDRELKKMVPVKRISEVEKEKLEAEWWCDRHYIEALRKKYDA